MKILTDKVAIVTGAGSGIGKSIARLFATEGAKVVASDINRKTLETTVSEITGTGGIATSVVTDVAREQEIDDLIVTTVNNYGSFDVLVNNAGVMDDFVPIEDVTNELWERVININLRGPFFACRQAVRRMLKQGSGVIINIASVAGLFGGRAGIVYNTSKHGLIGLTRSIAYAYACKGIRCNAIAPGAVMTRIGETLRPHSFGHERMLPGTATLPRVNEPIEIAQVALFLASDRSTSVNGTVVVADSGWTTY